MNVYDGGEKTITVSSGLGTLSVTNFRGRLDFIIVDAPTDTATYFVEILNATGKSIWLDQGTGDHPFKVNMIMGKGFTVRIRNADTDGAYVVEMSGEQGVK